MTGTPLSPREIVRPPLRTRQVREFTGEPLTPAEVEALAEVARWSGSSGNEQAWRFITICSEQRLRALAAAALPQTRPLLTATTAVAIVLPVEPGKETVRAYDDGRAAERLLIAAGLLGLGAGISWILPDVRPAIRAILGLPADRFVRTIAAVGHPTEAASQPKSGRGTARLPLSELVFAERWPSG